MRLESLELQGFKTFPDKTKLSFDHGISAVVGPNGSGKSNISDAVRWVLGEQSTRALRCSKMEDIVFSGSTSRRAQGFAQVTLTIDNSSRTLPFDGDTVCITRRYYRSGESEYQINHVTVRLKDIHELFMDTGLGRDGYSMIGQGKIDSIVSARSEDRREIFEEAAGISRYRYRKEESERKLAHAEDNLLRLQDILSELNSRIGPLREQAEKAKQYLTYAAEKQELEIGLWLHTLQASGRILREHDDKITIARNQQADILEAIQRLDTAMEENFQQASQCTVQAEELRVQAARNEEDALRLEGNQSVLENDIQHNKDSLERLEQERRSLLEQNRQQEQEEQEKSAALDQTVRLLAEKRQEEAECSEQLTQLRQGFAQACGQLEQDAKKLDSLLTQYSEVKLAALSAESSQNEIQLRLGTIRQAMDAKKAQEKELSESVRKWEERALQADRKATDLQQQVKQAVQQLEEDRRHEQTAKQCADQIHLDVQELTRRIHLLEELERNLEGFAHSVKLILKESSKGTLQGIHGPVSRLIVVPKEYTAAVETALGAAMQNVVVGTEDHAKAAIRFLKQRDAGRATFLPLTTVRGNLLSEPGLEQCPGFVGIAGNLCRCDPSYQGILRSLLGRIVVAQDLNAAVAIAKQYRYKFRVVTLDGQVIHPGGSLTGGSLAKHTGLLSRAAEIGRLRDKLSEKQRQETTALQAWEQSQTRVAQTAKKAEQFQKGLADAQEYRVEQNSGWSRVRSDWETFRHQQREMETEYQRTASRQKDLQATKQQAKARQELLELQIADMQQCLEQLTGSRDQSSEQIQQVSEKLQEIQLTVLSAQKDEEMLSQTVSDLRSKQQAISQRLVSLQEETQSLFQKNEALRKQIGENQTTAAKFREEAQQAKKTSTQVQQKRMELEQKSAEMRMREREYSSEKETITRELARLEERKAGVQKEYDKIIARLWEEYELTHREAREHTAPVEEPVKAQRRLNELKNQIRALGAVNVAAVEEYKEVSERHGFLSAQLADVERSRSELRRLIHDLTGQMQELFLERFQQINRNFKQTFVELFGGGSAFLELDHPEDLLTCGIQIAVQPPGKIVSNLELLSGGEKALVAIALYFAIMKVSPSPFCIMDEIEAALDESNVGRFAAYLRRMNAQTQFVVITHRRGTMEEADVLYGVTMQEEGVSKLLEMNLSELEETLEIR